MDLLQLLILALVQALTEFLPVSSSGHLVVASAAFGWPYQGLVVDLALHLGTLLALCLYFRRDLALLVGHSLAWRPGRSADREQRMALGLVLATLPAALCGFALTLLDDPEPYLRNLHLIGLSFIGFGLLLWYSDRRGGQQTADEFSIGIKAALLIGAFQALALIPGTSRSGIVMTAALLIGLSRPGAARYAFLLGIPITALASGHAALETLRGEARIDIGTFLVGVGFAALFGYAVIHGFLALIRRIGLLPFVIYRVLVGAAVLIFLV